MTPSFATRRSADLRTPDWRRGDHAARPLPVGQVDWAEGVVLLGRACRRTLACGSDAVGLAAHGSGSFSPGAAAPVSWRGGLCCRASVALGALRGGATAAAAPAGRSGRR